MSDARICPVCSGSGKYNDKECHGCGGQGWVIIPSSHPVPIIRPDRSQPYPHYPYPLPPQWYY